MISADYYELLDVAADVAPEAIDRAISEKRRFWQPRTNNPTLETRQFAEKRMRDISDAERAFSSASARSDYDRHRAGRANASVSTDASTDMNARGHDPDDARHHARLGDRHAKNGDWQAALDAFRQAREFAPGTIHYRVAIGVSLSALGEVSEGAALLGAAYGVEPNDGLLRYYMGCSLLDDARQISWTVDDRSRNICSASQLTETRQKLDEIDRLGVGDHAFQSEVDHIRAAVMQAETVAFRPVLAWRMVGWRWNRRRALTTRPLSSGRPSW